MQSQDGRTALDCAVKKNRKDLFKSDCVKMLEAATPEQQAVRKTTYEAAAAAASMKDELALTRSRLAAAEREIEGLKIQLEIESTKAAAAMKLKADGDLVIKHLTEKLSHNTANNITLSTQERPPSVLSKEAGVTGSGVGPLDLNQLWSDTQLVLRESKEAHLRAVESLKESHQAAIDSIQRDNEAKLLSLQLKMKAMGVADIDVSLMTS